MIVNGIEFDFNPLNANHIERIRTAQAASEAIDKEEKAKGSSDLAAVIRGQCRVVMVFIDGLLGEGASKQLGLDGNDLRACKKVSADILSAIRKEQEAVGFVSA